MSDALLRFVRARRRPAQSRPLPGRGQVRNAAGGWTFAVDDWSRLHRFLVLGTEGGTYYAREADLTRDNAGVVFRLVGVDGRRVVDEVVQLSESGAAPKQNPLLFTLAVAASVGDDVTRAHALAALPRVCRTGTMLFRWNAYCEQLRGWGRGRSRAVGGWYLRELSTVEYQVVKYRQREGWTHRDLLRLAHPEADGPARAALFDFVCGREPERGLLPLVDAYRDAQDPDADAAHIVELVRAGLPWEALPDVWLGSAEVWDALLDGIGLTALLRNLPRLTRLGLIAPYGPLDQRLAVLTDVAALKRARIHPVAVLNALFGYRSGASRGQATWTPVPRVVDLLDEAFHASFGAVVPAGKRTLVALDVSGSMTWSPLGSLPALTAADAAAAMAMVTVRTEPECFVTAFSHGLEPLPITGRQRMDDVRNVMARSGVRFGGTDCALPMLWARRKRLKVDTFVTYTDNETWCGDVHPTQALDEYRQRTGLPARAALTAMTSTGFSIADPEDAGQLDLVGFDAATPRVLADFSRGAV